MKKKRTKQSSAKAMREVDALYQASAVQPEPPTMTGDELRRAVMDIRAAETLDIAIGVARLLPASVQPETGHPWRSMASAPRDASWIIAKFKDEDVRRVHFAEDLSGSEQPAFKGWFYKAGNSFYGCQEPIGWLPDPPSAQETP